MYDCSEAQNKKIYVEFGEVEAGSTATKWIEIVNESMTKQIYEARRDATTNPLDHVFELCSYSWTISPGQTYKCKIYYRPFVPLSVNVDYFTIVNSTHNRAEIKVRGMCIGPVLSVSTTRLVMICTNENHETKKRIKLINDSNVTAIFMFDINLVQRSFKLDVKCGHIGPRSRKYITITFAPQEIGIYAYHLPCLILNHKPIIIELYGYCASTLHKADIQNRLIYPARVKNGFEGYTSDTIVAAQDLPTIFLSKNYIDFGQGNVEMENKEQKIPETLCVTNHSRFNVSIKWDYDTDNIFSITPAIANISTNQTTLFEVTFNPDRGSNLFSTELVGCVFTEQQKSYPCKKTLAFPTIASVRLIGHSFPTCSDGWIPQYEIPHIVKMPSCVPSFPTYTTFLIKKFGHLPLMYRFVPPASSHFVVKPMMGIIHQDYQIIVVAMLPGIENERIYVERWAIRFNGNIKSECFIDFSGFTEYANVNFSDQNIVSFAPTFPGCQQLQRFCMRNITRHMIKFEFVNLVPELRIRNKNDGEVCSNDILIHEWEFCPTVTGDYEFDINCNLTVLKDKVPIGSSICMTLRVIGRCEFGVLVSAPDELNFGIQAYKTTKELSFHVFNKSPVNIYYELSCRHCNWPVGDIENDVKIHPNSETVFAGQDKIITISVTPSTPGYYELFIQYCVRISPHTDALILNQTPRNICKLHSLCVLSTLKVMDLQCYGSCAEMSKAFLWKHMKINMLNTLFRDLQPGTSKTLHVNFPAMVLHKNPIVIKLLLTNATAVIASWNIKRVQLCSCRPIARRQGISFTRSKYDCLHRKICSIFPRTGNLKRKEEEWITLELHYELLGKTDAKWDINLGNNRHIFLLLTIESLSESENKLCLLSGTNFKFQHVYFGERNPVYQVYWVYNGTNRSIPFSVNLKKMCKINQEYCYEVFSYVIPHTMVNPQSSASILLKFQPRKFGIFKEKLPLILGNEEKELILEGESSLPHKLTTVGEYVPSECSLKDDDIPIYFNIECIDISNVAMHSHVVKMIMMYNNMVHDVFAYEWKRHEIPGVILVEIHPPKGLIKPMSVKSFHVTIHTKGYPCVIDVNIPCEFVNSSQRRAYQKSIYKHEILSQELEGQFTITEKGISIPKPTIKILEKPQPFYKTITIRCSIYSVEDKLLKVSLMEELISAPLKEIRVEKDKMQMTFNKEDIKRSSFIIEGLLWEIINSKLFKNLMQDILRDELNLFYSQFTMNLYERNRLIRRSYISPPRALINDILEKILFFIMHEEFALKTTHLIKRKDIRHKDYLNTVSSMKKSKTSKRGTRPVQYQDDKYTRTMSRISFAI